MAQKHANTKKDADLQNRYNSVSKQGKRTLKNSFFSAVAQKIQSTKLGDLLLFKGIITKEQLDNALKEQKITKKKIGAILVQQGSISVVQLYQKLTEQWCVKASTAGMTVFMSAVSYAPTAQADTPISNITLASISTSETVTSARKNIIPTYYPKLFGSKEIRSSDISSFNKWTGMLSRFERQINSKSSSPRLQKWKTTLHSISGLSAQDQITQVNNYINKQPYVSDNRNWSKSDYWSTPVEFLAKGGDCEDFAIAKYASLRALGFSHKQMRLAIVDDTTKGLKHAILIVYTTEGTFVLDNQDKRTRRLETVSRYKPIFSINKNNWWLHKA